MISDLENQLQEMGFDHEFIKKAIEETKGVGLSEALDWIATKQEKTDKHSEEGGEEEQEEGEGAKSLKCNDCGKLFSTINFAQFHAAKTGHEDFSETVEAVPDLTPEEKTAKLEELRKRLAEKRKLKEEETRREAKEAELRRRKEAQNSGQIKREMQEKELLKAAEQLKKDKAEEVAIRARIRAEMEEEKRIRREEAERAKLAKSETAQTMNKTDNIIKLESQPSDSVRLQVRLPDGQVIRAVFKSDDTLAKLIELIKEKTSSLSTNSKLVIPFPHKEIILNNSSDKTFMQLDLCPSASLNLQV